MTKQYILNKETQKIELQFSKEEYKALSDEDKKSLKRAFQFTPRVQAWTSRSTKNHYSAIQAAEKLGFANGGTKGERLSFAEQVEQEALKASNRADYYDHKAEKATQNAEQLQSAWNEASQDWSYVTQPIIAGHSGSQRFAKQRQKLLDRYAKGFDEYRKSDYFKQKAITAQETANQDKYNNASYLNNRIEECNKNIRAYERIINKTDNENSKNEEYLNNILEKLSFELDKLAFMMNRLEELGGNQYSKENVKAGYEVKIDKDWGKVVKANTKTLEVRFSWVNYSLKYNYAEVTDMRIPEDYNEQEASNKFTNPYNVDDIVTRNSMVGDVVIQAFQIIKKTEKSVTLQEINIIDNVPQLNNFKNDELLRRSVKLTRYNTIVINHRDWSLSKYNQTA